MTKTEHEQMIFDAWEDGQAIEGKRIKGNRWLDVPAKGSAEAEKPTDDVDYENWEYRLKPAADTAPSPAS